MSLLKNGGSVYGSVWGATKAAQEKARSSLLDLALEEVEIGRIERIHALRAMFGTTGGPSTQALAALAEHIMPVRIPRGTQLAREGSLLGIVYLIVEGKIVASRRGHPWGEFAAPGSIGFLVALAGGMMGIDCVAVEDTIALALRGEDMLEVLEDHFDLLLGAMRGFARSAIELRRQLPAAGFSDELRQSHETFDKPLDLVERILHLRQTFALQRSFVTEISEIARAAQEARIAEGTKLWSSGDVADHAIILLSGVIEGESPEGLRFRFGPGDIAGNLDTMAGMPRWFTATAAAPVVALLLHAEILIDVLEDHSELAFDFLRMFAAGLVDLRERVHERALREDARSKPSWTGPRSTP